MKLFFYNDKFPRNLGLLFGVSAGLIYYILSSEAYSHGPSSVGSSLGLFITFIATPIIGFIGFLVGASSGFLIFACLKKRHIISTKGIMSSVFLIAFLIISLGPFYHYVHIKFIINKINQMDRAQLQQAIHQYKNESSKDKPFIYSAIATNLHADAEIFHQVVMLQDPSLTQNMWSIGGLLGKNLRGYSVLRLIAQNKNSRVETLNLLAKSSDYYILEDVAGNPNTPIEMLYDIHNKNPHVYLSFLSNPNTPAEILIDIPKSIPDYLYTDFIYEKLKNHPNLTTEQRERLAKPKKINSEKEHDKTF